jgi:Phage integrase family
MAARLGPVSKPAVPRLALSKTEAVDALAVLRDYLIGHRLDRAAGLVFGRPDGTPFATSSVSLRATRAWKAAQLRPVTLHECRHTLASLMIAAGVNPKALQTFMGHSSITVTLDRYGHLFSAFPGLAPNPRQKGKLPAPRQVPGIFNGEGGIRTPEGPKGPYRFSRPAHSTALPPLQVGEEQVRRLGPFSALWGEERAQQVGALLGQEA